MSTVSELLLSIEQRAERAIVQELRLLIHEILGMRTALVLDDRAQADALLLKLDRLIDVQMVRPCEPRNASSPSQPAPTLSPLIDLDAVLPASPGPYEIRFFSRDYGDLEDVIIVDTFPLAVHWRSTDSPPACMIDPKSHGPRARAS